MRDTPHQGTLLFLPEQGEQPLSFDRTASLEVKPEHLMTELENQTASH